VGGVAIDPDLLLLRDVEFLWRSRQRAAAAAAEKAKAQQHPHHLQLV
jgi:hypothetical protein